MEVIMTPIPHPLVLLWGGGGEFSSKAKPRKDREVKERYFKDAAFISHYSALIS